MRLKLGVLGGVDCGDITRPFCAAEGVPEKWELLLGV